MLLNQEKSDYEVLKSKFYEISYQCGLETELLKGFLSLINKYFNASYSCIVKYDRVKDKFIIRAKKTKKKKSLLPAIWNEKYWKAAREGKYTSNNYQSVAWPILLSYDTKPIAKKYLWGIVALYRENKPFTFNDYNLIKHLITILAKDLKRRNILQLERKGINLARKIIKEQDPINLCYQVLHHVGRLIKYDHSVTLLTFYSDTCSMITVAETMRENLEENLSIGKEFSVSDEIIQFLNDTRGNFLFCKDGRKTYVRTFIQEKEIVHEIESDLGKVEIPKLVQTFCSVGLRNSIIICPLREMNSLVGILLVASRRSEAYELPDIEKILSVKEYAAKILSKVKSVFKELSILQELGTLLQSGRDVKYFLQPYKAILQLLLLRANYLLDADNSILLPYHPEKKDFEMQMNVMVGLTPAQFSNHQLNDPQFREKILLHGEYEWREENKSFYATTLKIDNTENRGNETGKVLGILLVQFEKIGEFEKSQSGITDREKETIKRFSSFASRIIDNRIRYQARIQELETLQKINLEIGKTKDLNDILRLIFKEGLELINADAGCLVVPNPVAANLRIIASHKLKAGKEKATINYGEGVTGYAALKKETVFIEDEDNPPPGIKPLPWVDGAHCEFAIPLLWRDPLDNSTQLLGVLSVERSITPSKFNVDEIELLSRLSTQAVIAIQNAKDRENLKTLWEVGKEITKTHEEKYIFEILLKRGMRQTGAYAASARVFDETGQFLEVIARVGDPGILSDKKIQVGDGVNGWVAKNYKTCLLSDVNRIEVNSERYPGLKYIHSHQNTQSELATPLMWENKCLGVINLEHKFTEGLDREVEFIEGIASQAAIELHNLYQQQLEMELKDFEIIKGLATHAAFLGHDMSKFFTRILNHLNEYENDEKLKHWRLEKIREEAENASKRIIELSRLVPKEDTQRRARISVKQLLEGVIKQLEVPLIKVSLKPDFNQLTSDLFIKGHIIQLQYVISQLVENAFRELLESKCNDKGEVILFALRDNDKIKITVEDNGPGIDPDKKKELFSFMKSFKTKGRGIGLYLCKSIIEDHNGSIKEDSMEGSGAKFIILIPLEEV